MCVADPDRLYLCNVLVYTTRETARRYAVPVCQNKGPKRDNEQFDTLYQNRPTLLQRAAMLLRMIYMVEDMHKAMVLRI